MQTEMTLPGLESIVKPFKFPATPYEYKVTPLRECPTPENLQLCETPDKAADYWRLHIATHSHFNPDCECLAVLLLNTRRKVKGHHIVSVIMASRNTSRGCTQADIKTTRDLIRASQLLKMDLLDHVIIGNGNRSSLRELGYFYA